MTNEEISAEAALLSDCNPRAAAAIAEVLRRVRDCGDPLATCAACRSALQDVKRMADAIRAGGTMGH